MTFEEFLKSLGHTPEQIKAIVDGMKTNKIYTASEENLDTRYGKLKTDNESVAKQLTEAQNLIEQLKKDNGSNETLQTKVSEYEGTVATLQEQLTIEKLESAIKISLLSIGCKDVDYVAFKLKEKGELSLDENGKVKGMDEKLAALKTQFPTQFESKEDTKIEEQKLPDDKNNQDKDTAPTNMADALKQHYEPKE
ncbi:MAG: phage scaffolding protein [Lachnotalea sp.]